MKRLFAKRWLGRWTWWALAICCAACAPVSKADRRPYQFSQGMIDPPDPLRSTKSSAKPKARPPQRPRRGGSLEAWRAQAAARARALAHQVLPGPRRDAQLSLLQQTFERSVPWPCTSRQKLEVLSAAPADILCFDNAHDANGNDRVDDPGADLGVVVETRGSSLRFAYLSGQRVRIGVLTPGHPHSHRRGGRIVNSYIRVKRRQDPARSSYLAAELVRGYVSMTP